MEKLSERRGLLQEEPQRPGGALGEQGCRMWVQAAEGGQEAAWHSGNQHRP